MNGVHVQTSPMGLQGTCSARGLSKQINHGGNWGHYMAYKGYSYTS